MSVALAEKEKDLCNQCENLKIQKKEILNDYAS